MLMVMMRTGASGGLNSLHCNIGSDQVFPLDVHQRCPSSWANHSTSGHAGSSEPRGTVLGEATGPLECAKTIADNIGQIACVFTLSFACSLPATYDIINGNCINLVSMVEYHACES